METTPTTDQVKEFSHPYANRLQENLRTQRKMEELLQKKINLLTEMTETVEKTVGFLDNTQSEKLVHYDHQIQLIKTQGELDILRKIIYEKDMYYKEYMVQFEKDIKEVDEKFKRLVDIAKKSTKPNVVKLIADIKWDRVDNDDEVKIAVYKQLKKHV